MESGSFCRFAYSSDADVDGISTCTDHEFQCGKKAKSHRANFQVARGGTNHIC